MLRMTRPLASGIVKIRDREQAKDDQGKLIPGEWKEVIHVLRSCDGPKPRMVSVPVMKRDARGDFERDENGEKIPYLRNGQPVSELKQDGWTPAAGRDYNDEEYVLSIHGAIMERC